MATTTFPSPDSTSQQRSRRWLYIYAIIPTEDHVLFDVDSIAGADAEVYTLSHNGLAAVVSRSSVAGFQSMQRQEAVTYLVAHQRVVESVMQDFPVLPVKFGTVLADEAQVSAMLQQGAELFHNALASITDRLQMEVVVLWDPTRIFAEISTREEIIQCKAAIAGRPPEETLAERVELGRLVQTFLEQRRIGLHEQIMATLHSVALDMVVNPVMDDTMVTNLGVLIDQARRDDLDAVLDGLDETFGEQFTFRCVGPLPPYSFATVEIRVPDFAEIDASRQVLELEQTVPYNAIKQAYYRLAGQAHPDYNPADANAEQHMAALTRAYHLLNTYAANQQRQQQINDAFAQNRICDFRQEAVDHTLLLSVRRQEATLQQ